MDSLDAGFDDATAVHIFPNRESAIRLLGALLLEPDEGWSADTRYFDMTAYR